MFNSLNEKVPRYFEPYVNDCFHNAYSAVLMYMGLNPNLILADYLSFMYDNKNDLIGVNYLYRHNTSVEFTEEELNTSLEFAYLPATSCFSSNAVRDGGVRYKDRVNINMYIDDNPIAAYSRLKELIDNGIPVVAAVDLYYMSYHKAYGKDHGLHCIVITGYNEEEGYFELFDKFALSNSDFDGRLPIRDVNIGRMSENPLSWGDLKRPVRNLWMELNTDKDFKVDEGKLINILNESYKRMTGQKEVLAYKCGLDALDSFINDLLIKKEEELDIKRIYWYRSYLNINFKNIARNRKRFAAFIGEVGYLLPEHLVSGLSDYLEESSKHWEISANIALKLGIRKSLNLTGELVSQLYKIRELEKNIVEKLDSCLHGRCLTK